MVVLANTGIVAGGLTPLPFPLLFYRHPGRVGIHPVLVTRRQW